MSEVTAAEQRWYSQARLCGARYAHETRGYPHAQLGPMVIQFDSTRVAGEHGHAVTPSGAAYQHPDAVNDNRA